MVAVKEVKGVTEELQPKLKEQGINDSDQLLKKAKTPAGRRELAGKLGVDPKVVLELANRTPPTVEMVKDWVSQAKALPKTLEY